MTIKTLRPTDLKAEERTNKKLCPKCGTSLERRGTIDSDQRILSSWYYCVTLDCGYDQRKEKD